MLKEILKFLAIVLAAIVVMYLHEVPKSIAYMHLNPLQNAQNKKSIYKIRQYIDPLGLIFFIIAFVGFSRPYAYRIKDKKTNYILGIVGLGSTLVVALLFYSLHQTLAVNLSIYTRFFSETEAMRQLYYFLEFFIRCIVLLSISLFLVNLVIPFPSFNIGLLIASKSPKKYFALYQYEHFIKLFFIILVAFNFFTILLRPIEELLFR
ncbi:hypothetical protein EDC18_104165 [Natranaerovirga pectinivora]|uniref:Uncharacterized protein n=1 Tax=Natranaerovirga pectinivora TaxID=682400 RepID=A0A4R3MME4_9FIRM|nr:hypothetical protein [Natranaerovirga pectinivora]TCT15015.1 hypothetical protein EDC18_104165 [Natranaerovirga pectinivora]